MAAQVTAMTAQAWQEDVTFKYASRTRLEYEVPGRRSDGTIKGKRLIRRFGYNLIRFVGAIFAFVGVVIIDSFIGSNGVDSFARSWRGKVVGQPNAAALPFADAASTTRRHVWIVGSASHLALVYAHGTQQPRILWHASGAQRPSTRKNYSKITWSDGSRVELSE